MMSTNYKRIETVTYGILLRRDIKYQRLAKGNDATKIRWAFVTPQVVQ